MERTKLRSKERQILIILFAIADLIEAYDEDFKTMLRARTKTGYRDIKSAAAHCNKMVSEIMDTAPIKDLIAIRKQLRQSKIEIRTAAAGGNPDTVWYLPTQDIAALVNAATQQCMLCDNKTGRGCELKKILEGLPVEISNDRISAYMACYENLKI